MASAEANDYKFDAIDDLLKLRVVFPWDKKTTTVATMTDCVDLANLRTITGGDPSVERELFTIFIESAAECLSALQANTGPAGSDEWRRQAHAFKGISHALGATHLGDLCRAAQHCDPQNLDEKARLANAITAEHDRVVVFVRDMLAEMPA